MMAHHSSDLFSGREDGPLKHLFAELGGKEPRRPTLGATQQFPQGKLTPEDEGEIRVGVTVYNGKVVIDFGKPTSWMGMDAEQARSLGHLLIHRARELTG
jgi:hypothetical protein